MKSININILIFILVFFCMSCSLYAKLNSLHFNQIIMDDSIKISAIEEALLNSNPQDAYVFYNDSLIGNTPLFVHSNFRNLTLRKSGYDDLNISYNDITQAKIFSMIFNGKDREVSFFGKDMFKILVAGIVVLGGTTAYFKLKADNKFDEYQFSGDGALLSETRKFDLISGITFGALQVNFAMLLYYFLIE